MVAILSTIFVTIYILTQGSKDYERCVLKIYMFVLVVPLSSVAELNTIDLLKVGPINILEVAIIEIFVLGILNKKLLKINKDSTLILAWLLLVTFILFLILSMDKDRSLSDAKDYIVPVLLFISMHKALYGLNDAWKVFIHSSLRALQINSFLIFIVYWFYWFPSGFSGRYGFSCETLYVVTIPVQLFSLLKHRIVSNKEKRCLWCAIFVQTFLIFVSQGRTLILCTIGIIALYSLFDISNRNSGKSLIKKISFLILMIAILIGGYCYLGSYAGSRISWQKRMLELIESGFNTQSNVVRSALISYYIPLIIKSPFGVGFGASMPVWGYTNGGVLSILSESTLAIDNVPLTFIYKMGFLPFLIYVMIFGIGYYRLLKTKHFEDKIDIIQLSMVVIILPAVIMSCQSLKNTNVACFFWGFVCGTRYLLKTNQREQ